MNGHKVVTVERDSDTALRSTMSPRILSASEAQRLTQRIKLTASTIRDNLFKLRNLVDEAKNSNAWNMLGFESWTAYLSDTLSDEPMRLGREERQELVSYLAGEGMSTRAIAPIVAVDQKTVSNDLRREENSSPDLIVNIERAAAPRTVTTLAGKSYTTPTQKPPKRKPLPSKFFEAVTSLQRAVASIEDIANDDRFASYREEFKQMHHFQLEDVELRLLDFIERTLDGKDVE